jgi:hypothetical protein
MKKRYLAVGLLALALKGKPQAVDTTYQKRDLSRTEIELLFSQYHQDGDHSAVTGGKGTENLNVYAPGFSVGFYNDKNAFVLAAGGDVISSASTDMIDSIPSSASVLDIRTHARFNYSRKVGKNGIEVGVGTGFSIESDYLSIPVRAFLNYAEPSGMRTYQASVEAFFDDLRWGRLNDDYRKPVTLIYPAELRYQEWYDVHNRYSYNFKTGITQVINKRLLAGFFPEFIYQQGLLATPFHRVYFTDGDLRVENLPKQRYRFPLSLRVNYFAGSRTILKAQYGFYRDNFGILANFIELESGVKVTPMITLSPFIHLYSQSASDYFSPYGQHDPLEEYYSSDYDLSGFNALKAGLGFRWAPGNYFSKRNLFNELNLRYSYFVRSDNLASHILTASFSFTRQGK